MFSACNQSCTNWLQENCKQQNCKNPNSKIAKNLCKSPKNILLGSCLSRGDCSQDGSCQTLAVYHMTAQGFCQDHKVFTQRQFPVMILLGQCFSMFSQCFSSIIPIHMVHLFRPLGVKENDHHLSLPGWRLDATNNSKRVGGRDFSSMEKHTLELCPPTWGSLLFVVLPTEFHCWYPEVPLVPPDNTSSITCRTHTISWETLI